MVTNTNHINLANVVLISELFRLQRESLCCRQILGEDISIKLLINEKDCLWKNKHYSTCEHMPSKTKSRILAVPILQICLWAASVFKMFHSELCFFFPYAFLVSLPAQIPRRSSSLWTRVSSHSSEKSWAQQCRWQPLWQHLGHRHLVFKLRPSVMILANDLQITGKGIWALCPVASNHS